MNSKNSYITVGAAFFVTFLVSTPLLAQSTVVDRIVIPDYAVGQPFSINLDTKFLFDLGLDATSLPAETTFLVDFGDGNAPQNIPLGGMASTVYSSAGDKLLKLTEVPGKGLTSVVRAGEQLFLRGGQFGSVVPPAGPVPDETWYVQASVAYDGRYGSGDAEIYSSEGRAGAPLDRPVLVVEGFDPHNRTGARHFYTVVERLGLMTALRQQGLDVIYLNFHDGGGPIQRNAKLLISLIDRVNAQKTPGADLSVIGFSMGGLVSRYALASMEAAGQNHQARLFLAVDTPFQGANIPLGIQAFSAHFGPFSSTAATIGEMVRSPAAKQMLLHHYEEGGLDGGKSPLFDQFQSELRTLGYPRLTRNVAVVNGRSNGVGFSRTAQNPYFYAQGGGGENIVYFYVYPAFPNQRVFNAAYRTGGNTRVEEDLHAGPNIITLDNVPGSVLPEIPSDKHFAFVPTVSALDFQSGGNWYYNIAGDPSRLTRTPFNRIYLPPANSYEGHIQISVSTKNTLLVELNDSVSPAVALKILPAISILMM